MNNNIRSSATAGSRRCPPPEDVHWAGNMDGLHSGHAADTGLHHLPMELLSLLNHGPAVMRGTSWTEVASLGWAGQPAHKV